MRNQEVEEYFKQAKDKIRKDEDKLIINYVKSITEYVNRERASLVKAVDAYDKISAMTREELLDYAKNNNYGR